MRSRSVEAMSVKAQLPTRRSREQGEGDQQQVVDEGCVDQLAHKRRTAHGAQWSRRRLLESLDFASEVVGDSCGGPIKVGQTFGRTPRSLG